jgi:hypothetical protein
MFLSISEDVYEQREAFFPIVCELGLPQQFTRLPYY